MTRICIVGCGAVVESAHARVLPVLRDRLRVTGCYDVDVDRARTVANMFGARLAGHVDDLPGDLDRWDAALIATPPAFHAPLALGLLGSGKHVLVEKPFATVESDARAIVGAAAAGGLRALVGHFRRYYPSVQAARAFLAAEGGAAAVERIEAWEGARWSWPARSSYAFTHADGGVALDTGSHVLDVALYVLGLDEGEPELALETVHKEPPTEPSQDVEVRASLRSGAATLPLLFRVSRLEPLAGALKLRLRDGGWIVVPGGYAPSATHIVAGAPRAVPPPGDATYLPPDPMSAFYCEYLDLLRSIEEPAYISAIDARRFVGVTRILERITTAAGRAAS